MQTCLLTFFSEMEERISGLRDELSGLRNVWKEVKKPISLAAGISNTVKEFIRNADATLGVNFKFQDEFEGR